MSDSSYLLVGYPQGEPAAFVVRENTDLLRRGIEDPSGTPQMRLPGGMTKVTALAMRIMEGSASVVEQQNYAHGLIAADERLQRRVEGTDRAIIDGEVVVVISISLPEQTVDPGCRS